MTPVGGQRSEASLQAPQSASPDALQTAAPAGGLAGLVRVVSPALAARLAASPLAARLARGAFWTTAGALASRVLALAAAVVVARLLGPTAYGEFGTVQTTAVMFQALGGLGMGLTATKFVAELRHKDPARAGRILGLSLTVALAGGVLVGAAVFAFAPQLAAGALAAPQLAGDLRIGALAMVLGAWNGAQVGALAGFEAFRATAKATLVSGVVGLPLAAGGAWLGGVRGAVWGFTAASLATCVVHRFVLLRVMRAAAVVPSFRGLLGESRVLFGFGLPSALAMLLVAPVNWACSAMVAHQPDGYTQLGLFNAAAQWRIAVQFLPATLGAAVLPLLSSLRGGDDHARYARVLKANLLVTAALSLVVALGVAFASPLIMRAYGAGFSGGAPVLVLLAAAAAAAAVLGIAGQSLASSGRMWWGFALNALWGGVMLGAAWWLRDRGALGLALANLVAYGVHGVSVGLFVWFDLRRGRGQAAAGMGAT